MPHVHTKADFRNAKTRLGPKLLEPRRFMVFKNGYCPVCGMMVASNVAQQIRYNAESEYFERIHQGCLNDVDKLRRECDRTI